MRIENLSDSDSGPCEAVYEGAYDMDGWMDEGGGEPCPVCAARVGARVCGSVSDTDWE